MIQGNILQLAKEYGSFFLHIQKISPVAVVNDIILITNYVSGLGGTSINFVMKLSYSSNYYRADAKLCKNQTPLP